MDILLPKMLLTINTAMYRTTRKNIPGFLPVFRAIGHRFPKLLRNNQLITLILDDLVNMVTQHDGLRDIMYSLLPLPTALSPPSQYYDQQFLQMRPEPLLLALLNGRSLNQLSQLITPTIWTPLTMLATYNTRAVYDQFARLSRQRNSVEFAIMWLESMYILFRVDTIQMLSAAIEAASHLLRYWLTGY